MFLLRLRRLSDQPVIITFGRLLRLLINFLSSDRRLYQVSLKAQTAVNLSTNPFQICQFSLWLGPGSRSHGARFSARDWFILKLGGHHRPLADWFLLDIFVKSFIRDKMSHIRLCHANIEIVTKFPVKIPKSVLHQFPSWNSINHKSDERIGVKITWDPGRSLLNTFAKFHRRFSSRIKAMKIVSGGDIMTWIWYERHPGKS